MPYFSIITVSFERPQFLPMAISSLLNQSYKDFELIISDSSKEHRKEIESIISRYAEMDNRVKPIFAPFTRDPVKTRNAAVGFASGEILVNADDDDASLPWRLEVTKKAFEEDIVLFSANAQMINKDGRVHGDLRKFPFEYRTETGVKKFMMHSATAAMRTQAVYDVGLYPRNYNHGADKPKVGDDWELYIKMMERFNKGVSIDDVIALYRIHEGQVTKNG